MNIKTVQFSCKLLVELSGFARKKFYRINYIYIIMGFNLIFIYLLLNILNKTNYIINNGKLNA